MFAIGAREIGGTVSTARAKMEISDMDGVVYVFPVARVGSVYRQIRRPVVFNVSGGCRSFPEERVSGIRS